MNIYPDFSETFEPIHAGNLTVRTAINMQEVLLSEKLRYTIFYDEMGGTPEEYKLADKRDFDKFDDYCHHLLVIDNDKAENKRVVGTYRLLRGKPAKEIGGFYTEAEYDVSALKKTDGEIMELGRACVQLEYRSRAVMQLLWRGIGAYINAFDVKIMFGCASFTGVDPKVHAIQLSYLYHNHLAPADKILTAKADLYVDMNMIPADEINNKRALASLPALIKGYLRLGGWIGDGAVIDFSCNTTDVGIIVQSDLLADKYGKRYT